MNWKPADIIAALEWQAEQDALCPHCRQPLTESMKKENSFAYRAEALRCHSCYAIDAKAAALRKNKEDPLAGVRFRTWRDQTSANGSG